MYVGGNPLSYLDDDGLFKNNINCVLYPKSCEAVDTFKDRITDEMRDAWKNEVGSSNEEINQCMSPNSGPKIEDWPMKGASGNFKRERGIRLNDDLLASFERGDVSQEDFDRLLGHEATHHLDPMGETNPVETGDNWERRVYGEVKTIKY